MKKILSTIIMTFLMFFSFSLFVTAEEILLDNPELITANETRQYRLLSSNLHLPEEIDTYDYTTEDRLTQLISLYDRNATNNSFKNSPHLVNNYNIYEIEVEREERVISINPLPGVSLEADFNKQEENNSLEEDSNISLKYWMNNRTLLSAEYGFENREWWDIKEIRLENDDQNSEVYIEELVYKEEKSESSRLGIAYQGNDRLTISAEINDLISFDTDYSTLFAIEYKDNTGRVRYIYQHDFGDRSSHRNAIEFGYKDLATFMASYKVLNPKLIEEQLESIWDFGLDFSINEISNFSLGYQLKEGSIMDLGYDEQEEKESNIKAKLEISF
ncbi:hypothetical protein [Natronospora cellulosivora (SeqCode)]